MSHEVYYQFAHTAVQARLCGARGGKTTARNRRQRQEIVAAARTEPSTSALKPQATIETTAAAMARLDAQYPWLRGAEGRHSKSRSQRTAA